MATASQLGQRVPAAADPMHAWCHDCHFHLPGPCLLQGHTLVIDNGLVAGHRVLPDGWVNYSTSLTPGSERFGYIGTLTLFDPPNRLDRIELSQVTDNVHAMGRYAHKHGDSLYMCYVEVHDWPDVRQRLLDANARYTPRGADPVAEPDGGWVHPKELHGLLLGISRTGVAWDWSGRKDLVPPA